MTSVPPTTMFRGSPAPEWVAQRVHASRTAFLAGGIAFTLSAAYLTYAYVLDPWEGAFLPVLNWAIAALCLLEWRMRWGLTGLARWAWETQRQPPG